MRKVIYQLALMAIIFQAQGQTRALDRYMSAVHGGSYEAVPATLLETNQPMDLFESLVPYQSDTVPRVRARAYYMLKAVGQGSSDASVRRQAVQQLVTGLGDQDSGIVGNAIEALSGFDVADFGQEEKGGIARFLRPDTPHLDQLLMLSGYLQIPQTREAADNIMVTTVPYRVKWSAHLALARMGEQESIDYLLGKLRSAPVNDDFVYDFVPDLVYTRQPAIYEYLEGIIQSEETNCLSANPDASDRILCGYRVMEYLAPVIVDYPLPIDEFGELMVDDYAAALIEVRDWLAANDSYVISSEGY